MISRQELIRLIQKESLKCVVHPLEEATQIQVSKQELVQLPSMSEWRDSQEPKPVPQRQGAINCFVGDVGSGKSLRCVGEAIMAAQSGRHVYMNFPLKPNFAVDFPEMAERIHYVQDFYGFLEEREMEARQGKIYKEFEALFLIDEAQDVWNSRTQMQGAQVQSTNYIFVSRKIGLEMHMATQLASSIDKRAKLLVQVWIVCTKMIYHGQYFFQFEWYHPEAGRVKTTYYTPEVAARFYPYYETTTPTSIGPMAPVEIGEERERAIRPMSAKAFSIWRRTHEKKESETLKALKKELRDIQRSVGKIEKVMAKSTKKPKKTTQRRGKRKQIRMKRKGKGRR